MNTNSNPLRKSFLLKKVIILMMGYLLTKAIPSLL